MILPILLLPLISQAQGRLDLVPRNTYWQVFPSDVRSVKIDPRGQAWLELDGNSAVEQIKQQVEHSFRSPAHWVKSAQILLFDSSGRIWLTAGNKKLLAFDPASGNWIERNAIGTTPGAESDSTEHDFCGPAIEDATGRIYIGDRSGCELFDHGTWSYQPFYEANVLVFGPSHRFDVPHFVRDERGRIFAWTTWGTDGCAGTLGFWVHEGARWHQASTGRISAVVPLRDGKVLICPESGSVTVARVDFDDSTDLDQLRRDVQILGFRDFRQRRAAEHRVLELGPHVLPELRKSLSTASSPEQRNRLERIIELLEEMPQQPRINDFSVTNARLAGYDNLGNAVLWADTVGPDGRAGRTAAWLITPDARVLPAPEPITDWAPHSLLTDSHGRLFMSRYQKGLGMLKGEKLTQLSDDTDVPFDEILGQDSAGRIYVRNKWHVAAINLEVADTRPALKVTAFELSSSRAAACQDSTGRIVAKLSGAEHPFLSIYENHRFVDFPVPAGSAWISDVAYLQPLKEGGLIAQEQPGSDVFLFDGKTWAAFRSFRTLIEARHAVLTGLIDNRRTGIDSYAGLRVDAHAHLWCMQWDHVDAYEGKSWTSLSGSRPVASRAILYCLPMANGNVVLSDGASPLLAQSGVSGISVSDLSLQQTENSPSAQIGLRIDSGGRAWLPRNQTSAVLVSQDRAQVVEQSGFPRLEDSSGRIWFVDPANRRLVILLPDGSRTYISDDALSEDSTIAQESSASWWVNTRSGLRHLIVDRNGTIAEQGDPFEKGIPKGACNGMWIDPDHNLWFSGSGRLYLIRLPRN